MTMRATMTALRDWAALLGAVAMVGFLTFVPQHASVSGGATRSVQHHAATDWPSRTAGLDATDAALR